MESIIRRHYGKGMLAGLIATFVLSGLIVMKAQMGLMPELDPIQMLGNMVGGGSRTIGWAMHFVIGTVLWGLLFTAIFGAGPGRFWWRGIVFATGAWLVMMIVLMPMAGAGLFGMNLGMMAPVMTLMMHVVYGAVLGGGYAGLVRDQVRAVSSSRRIAG